MDFGMGHLSADAGPAAQMGVKELMEARKVNAREDRALHYRSRILERAHAVHNKDSERQLRMLRSKLDDIEAKSPYLNSFAPRYFAHQRSLQRTRQSQGGAGERDRKFWRKAAVTRNKPQESVKLPPLSRSVGLNNTARVTDTSSSSTDKYRSHDSPPSQPEVEESDKSTFAQTERQRNVTYTTQNVTYTTQNCIRKTKYIGFSLKRIYDERQRKLDMERLRMLEEQRPMVAASPLQRAHGVLQSSILFAARLQQEEEGNA